MKLQQAENFPRKISHLVYGTAFPVFLLLFWKVNNIKTFPPPQAQRLKNLPVAAMVQAAAVS